MKSAQRTIRQLKNVLITMHYFFSAVSNIDLSNIRLSNVKSALDLPPTLFIYQPIFRAHQTNNSVIYHYFPLWSNLGRR